MAASSSPKNAAPLVLRRFAHELNAQLGVVVMAASIQQDCMEQLAAQLQNQPGLQQLLLDIRESADLAQASLQCSLQLVQDTLGRRPEAAALEHYRLETCVQTVLAQQRKRFPGITVQCQVEAPSGWVLAGDPLVWRQIFTNLVANSLVHGFEGRSMGCIRVQATVSAQGLCTIDYRDDGVGLSSGVVDSVFDDGFSTQHGQGAYGLGLGIVRHLLQHRLHGVIQAQPSSLGAHFCIAFPRTPDRAGSAFVAAIPTP
jgi:signal transduction histidine kinase